MDANEEILTSNMQSSELIADGYHLNDPKTISWALAYSKAVHSPFWEKAATDKEKEKLVSGFRSKILGQAASKKDGSKEHNLAKILLEEPEDGPEGVDMARKKLEELYEPEMVKEYVQAHLEYAAKVIAPFLPDMSVQDIINTVEKRRGDSQKAHRHCQKPVRGKSGTAAAGYPKRPSPGVPF